jgi:hypothetical protein
VAAWEDGVVWISNLCKQENLKETNHIFSDIIWHITNSNEELAPLSHKLDHKTGS